MRKKQARPDIFRFHDYRTFLKEWLDYQKSSQAGFSMRTLSKQAGVASGYLPMVLGGRRHLSSKALQKISQYLGLDKNERSYLELLVTLGTSDAQSARVEALERMKKFRSYRESNPRETEVYQYLTRWYYVAIREMAALPGFVPNAEWVQAQLKSQVPLGEIEQALQFLVSNGYIELSKSGKAAIPEKGLECVGGVYRVALTQFHQEMFTLAARSIIETPSDERRMLGHTVALSPADVEEAMKILDDAVEKLRKLGAGKKKGGRVYHAELALFPLTRRSEK